MTDGGSDEKVESAGEPASTTPDPPTSTVQPPVAEEGPAAATRPAGVTLPPLTIVVAAAASAAAGLVHATAAGTHAGDRTLVILFALTAVAQLAWAAVAMVKPARPVLIAGVALNGAAAVAWVLSRSYGLPIIDSLSEPEVVGAQDVIAAALAALAAVAALLAVANPVRRAAHAVPALLCGAAVFALAVPAMAVEHSSGPSHDHGHSATEPDGDSPDEEERGRQGDRATREERHERRAEREAAEQSEDGAAGSEAEDGHSHGGAGGTGEGSDVDPIISLDDARVTPEQRSAAQNLIDTTTAAMAQYTDEAAVEAAGYNSIGDGRTGFEHFVNFQFLTDGVELDPARVESIVFQVDPDGTKQLASAMYILSVGKTMADVPDIAGALTTWHDHQDLCWDANGRVVGLFRNGACRPAGTLLPTPPMLHVWMVPNECGPFAGIEGSHGDGC